MAVGASTSRTGRPLHAGAVVVATGGLSVPNTGSDGAGLRIVKGLGHDGAADLRRADAAHRPPGTIWRAVGRLAAGDDHGARRPASSSTATGGFLFTHHGYSGPAVLDVSHVAVRSRMDGGRSGTCRRAMDVARRRASGPTAPGLTARARVLSAVGDAAAVTPGRGACCCRRGSTRACRLRTSAAPNARLIDTLVRGDAAVDGRRRLQEGRGHRRRRQPGRGRSANDGEPAAQAALSVRRDARRVRSDRRLQLPLGLGHGPRGRTGGICYN